jgi:hypothetical protein
MNSEEFDEEFDLEGHSALDRPIDLDRSMRLKYTIERIFDDNKELFERFENG